MATATATIEVDPEIQVDVIRRASSYAGRGRRRFGYRSVRRSVRGFTRNATHSVRRTTGTGYRRSRSGMKTFSRWTGRKFANGWRRLGRMGGWIVGRSKGAGRLAVRGGGWLLRGLGFLFGGSLLWSAIWYLAIGTGFYWLYTNWDHKVQRRFRGMSRWHKNRKPRFHQSPSQQRDDESVHAQQDDNTVTVSAPEGVEVNIKQGDETITVPPNSEATINPEASAPQEGETTVVQEGDVTVTTHTEPDGKTVTITNYGPEGSPDTDYATPLGYLMEPHEEMSPEEMQALITTVVADYDAAIKRLDDAQPAIPEHVRGQIYEMAVNALVDVEGDPHVISQWAGRTIAVGDWLDNAARFYKTNVNTGASSAWSHVDRKEYPYLRSTTFRKGYVAEARRLRSTYHPVSV